MMKEKKGLFKRTILILYIISTLSILSLFLIYWPYFLASLEIMEGIEYLIVFMTFRIMFTTGVCYFFYLKWFKQEAIYTSDAYFLIGSYFFIMIYGKAMDMFLYLTNVVGFFPESSYLIIVKLRYVLMLFNAMPLLYIGLEALITLFNTYIKDLTRKQFNKIRMYIILGFIALFSMIIMFSPSLSVALRITPIMAAIIMLGIVIMFIFMYANKRLSQANGLIVGIGFLLFVITSIAVSLLLDTEELMSAFIAEALNFGTYCIVLIGFLVKPKYARHAPKERVLRTEDNLIT